jgi:hypothetical protein
VTCTRALTLLANTRCPCRSDNPLGSLSFMMDGDLNQRMGNLSMLLGGGGALPVPESARESFTVSFRFKLASLVLHAIGGWRARLHCALSHALPRQPLIGRA